MSENKILYFSKKIMEKHQKHTKKENRRQGRLTEDLPKKTKKLKPFI